MTNSYNVPQTKSRRGCVGCLGCMGGAGILAGLLILVIVLTPTLLRAVGLRGPGAEELFSGAPDPVATQALRDTLANNNVTGVNAWVIPIQGSEAQIAIVSFDDAAAVGGLQSRDEAETFLLETMREIAAANRTSKLGIEYTAMIYQDEAGQALITTAAPQEALEAYANGTISRQQFLAQVEIDFSGLISAAELQQLLREETR